MLGLSIAGPDDVVFEFLDEFIGGAPALRRVGEVGDGWFGVNVTPESAKAHIERIKSYAQAAGRNPAKLHFSVSPGIPGSGEPITLDVVKRFRDLGVHQVIVGALPTTPEAVKGEIEQLAEKITVPAASL